MTSISRALRRALATTDQASAAEMARTRAAWAMLFSATTMTRSPGLTPRSRSHPLRNATFRASSP